MVDKNLSNINKINKKKVERIKLRKKKRRNRMIFTFVLSVLQIIIGFKILYLKDKSLKVEKYNSENSREVVISIGGNCVLGNKSDDNEVKDIIADEERGYKYFLKDVQSILSKDDFSIVNLESPINRFKTDYKPSLSFEDYSNVMKDSSIDGVVLSNFGDNKNKAVKVFEENNISISNGEDSYIKEINGVKIGIISYNGWGLTDDLKVKIASDVENLNRQGVKFKIAYFNWGNREETEQNEVQEKVARFAIDNGVDAVIGNYPESIQGIENYNGKLIAYSLGNLCYTGELNKNNTLSYILQIKLNVNKEELVNVEYKIIPVIISDTGSYIYKTSLADEKSKNSILKKLNKTANDFKNEITERYFEIK